MNLKQIAFSTFLLFTACLNIVFSNSFAYADSGNPVGKVVAVRNKVMAVQNTVSRNLKLKDPVFINDIIKTQNGRVQLMFNDNTLITLARKTEIKITEYFYKPGDTSSLMTTKVKEGSFRIMGGAITRLAPENFKTQAPSGTIGIRGSMYAGIVKADNLFVLFQGGKGIYVQNEKGMVNITTPGFGTSIQGFGQAPSKPEKLGDKDLDQFEKALAVNTLEDDSENSSTTTSDPEKKKPIKMEQAKDSTKPNNTSATKNAVKKDTITHINSIITETIIDSTKSDIIPTTFIPEEQPVINLLQTLGFSGHRTNSPLPDSGIWVYEGKLTGIDEDQNNFEDYAGMAINWSNKRIIVFDDPLKDPDVTPDTTHSNDHGGGLGFGLISSSGKITNFHVLGSGADHDSNDPNASDDPNSNMNFFEPMAITGQESFGWLYGNSHDAIGIIVNGYDISISDQTIQYPWEDTIAAVFDHIVDTAPPSTGSMTWNGFHIGVAEDMGQPDLNRRIFINTDPENFELVINKDNGTFSGILKGFDYENPSNILTGLDIGGDIDSSVYISVKGMAAFIKGDNAISNTFGTGSLKPHGNFMVTAKEPFLSNYSIWGYWEAAYKEPGTGKNYHIHAPGSLWIAGEQSSASAINNLIATSFTGNYTGNAKGIKLNPFSLMTELSNGNTNLIIDFDPGSFAPVHGQISFDQVVLNVTSMQGSVTNSGFNAIISDSTGAGSHGAANGIFFGTNANGIGGNFSANMPDGSKYHGIFAGDR
jgi:hypothetical protein